MGVEQVNNSVSGNAKIQKLKETQWKDFSYPLPSENFDELSPAQQHDVEVAYEQCIQREIGDAASGSADGDSQNPPATNPNGTANQTPEGGNESGIGGVETGSGGGSSVSGSNGVSDAPQTDGAEGGAGETESTDSAPSESQVSEGQSEAAAPAGETDVPAESVQPSELEQQTEAQPEQGN